MIEAQERAAGMAKHSRGSVVSDSSQGEGWWEASDGKWYPPESSTPPPPPPPSGGSAPPPPPPAFVPPPPQAPPTRGKGRGVVIGLATCGGLFVVAIILILVLAAISDDDDVATVRPATTAGGASGNDTDDGPETDGLACKDADPDQRLNTKTTALYPERPNSQSNDHEAVVGDCVRLAGYTVYVDSVSTEPELGEMGGDPITVISVTVENRDDSSQSFNEFFDWELQTPGGQVLNPTIFLGEGSLGSGDLIPGGSASGKVAFDVPPGTYYVIFTPFAQFSDDRGIWEVTST
jgi:hypothetical protein